MCDRRTDGPTNIPSYYRDARTHLKTKRKNQRKAESKTLTGLWTGRYVSGILPKRSVLIATFWGPIQKNKKKRNKHKRNPKKQKNPVECVLDGIFQLGREILAA